MPVFSEKKLNSNRVIKVSKIPTKQLIAGKLMKELAVKNRFLNMSEKKMQNVQKMCKNTFKELTFI